MAYVSYGTQIQMVHGGLHNLDLSESTFGPRINSTVGFYLMYIFVCDEE